jgi:hypothetical protein
LWVEVVRETNPTHRPVVCPDCNIKDALLSNMIREIQEVTAYTQCLLV